MGYDQLVEINDALENHPDLEKLAVERQSYIQRLIDDFTRFYEVKFGVTLSTIDDVALNLSYAYFSMCYAHIKPVIEDKANRYKMASLMELLIVRAQVLKHPDAEDNDRLNRKLNAQFAMTAAFSMINCMISDATKEFYFDTINTEVNNRVEKVLDDHVLWLETKPLSEMPIFINAQFHELVEALVRAPYQMHG